MATITDHYGVDRAVPPIAIYENSTFLKAISYIPILGMVPSYFQERSLDYRLTRERDIPTTMELINIKNQYKVANAVRCLLTAALIAAEIALGMIGGPFGAALILALVGLTGRFIYEIHQNNRIVSALETTGFRQGLEVL